MSRTRPTTRPRTLRTVAPGAAAWADLGTTAGTAAAARFYCGLFGWSVVARHRPLDDGVGRWTFRHGGRDVGGLAPSREATWSVTMVVTDIDARALAVTGNGGTVLAGPVRVDAGCMAVCADPLGATFVMWEPDCDTPGGPAAGDEPTSCQLACRDGDAARAFYQAVFGWQATTTRLADGSAYTAFSEAGTGRRVAGMVEMGGRWGRDEPARWMFHLEVRDADGTAALAAELGGTVSVAPFDVPSVGRLAVLNDPERATFSVLQAAA